MAKYLREIKQHCSDLRTVLLDAQIATAEEIAPYWPGGESNPDKTAFASWRYTLFNLARFSARAEARQEYRHGASPARSQALLSLQAGEPRVVELSVPLVVDGQDGPEELTEVRLDHKAWTALRAMASLARVGGLLVQEAFPIYSDGTHAELLVEIDEWRERIQRTLVWAAIARGPLLPWDARTERWPTPPAWVNAMYIGDVRAIQMAWSEQHAQALMALAPFINPERDEPDPLSGWETFFASYASEKGLFAQELMDDRAFLPFFTQITLASDASRRAREDAKNKPAPEPTATVHG